LKKISKRIMKNLRLVAALFAAVMMMASCGGKGAKPDAVAKEFMAKRYALDYEAAKKLCTASGATLVDGDMAMMTGAGDEQKARVKAAVWEINGTPTVSETSADVSMKDKTSGDAATLTLVKEGDKWLVNAQR
jgi:hypothetical protein